MGGFLVTAEKEGPVKDDKLRQFMTPLPFAISIPHGGTEIPEEFAPYLKATPECMREDVDHFTREIFGLPEGRVAHLLTFPISRTFVDLNRPPHAVGEAFSDGVVKRRTHLGFPVFSEFPPQELVDQVLRRSYQPYHQALQLAVADPRVKLTIDCHSMAPLGLPVSPDAPGKKRPPICLGYKGGESASVEVVAAMRDIMAEVYQVPLEDIWLDDPFNGGYITATYGSVATPVIQVEFSRGFYMEREVGKSEPWLGSEELDLWLNRFDRTLERLANHPIFR